MKIIIDTTAGQTRVLEGSDLQRLSASVLGAGDVTQALAAMGQADADGAHLWLDINALRHAAAPANDPAWGEQFKAMIAYATRKGWVDGGGTRVRVHLTRE